MPCTAARSVQAECKAAEEGAGPLPNHPLYRPQPRPREYVGAARCDAASWHTGGRLVRGRAVARAGGKLLQDQNLGTCTGNFFIALSLGIPSAHAPRTTHALHITMPRTTVKLHTCHTSHRPPGAVHSATRSLGSLFARQLGRSATRSLGNSIARQLGRSATRSLGNSVTRWLGSLLSPHHFRLCNLTDRSLVLLGLKVYLPSATRTRKRVPTE
jgi:hypothetical protein